MQNSMPVKVVALLCNIDVAQFTELHNSHTKHLQVSLSSSVSQSDFCVHKLLCSMKLKNASFVAMNIEFALLLLLAFFMF